MHELDQLKKIKLPDEYIGIPCGEPAEKHEHPAELLLVNPGVDIFVKPQGHAMVIEELQSQEPKRNTDDHKGE